MRDAVGVMRDAVDVLIVGAGPYGLSLACHLRAKGVGFRILGRPMESWKVGMPAGMKLKSHAWASSLFDPSRKLTLLDYGVETGEPLAKADTPTLERFVAYAEAFQRRLVPQVEPKFVTRLKIIGDGFEAQLDDGELVRARRVVIAVGVHPFKNVPDALRRLPAETYSHSGDYGVLDGFSGRSVAVIGAGASATDLAGLLDAKGARVSLIARASGLKFADKTQMRKSALRRAASWLKPVLRPGSGIGGGWLLKICADAPFLFHPLPRRLRSHIVATQLGPLGHSDMKARVLGELPLFLGRELEAADFADGKVTLRLRRGESQEVVEVDHVVAATGYKIDVARLTFLEPALLSRIATANGAPVLSMNYESTASGLYFIGPAAADSFGPVMRFVFGASHPARRLASRLTGGRAAQKGGAALKVAGAQFEGRDG